MQEKGGEQDFQNYLDKYNITKEDFYFHGAQIIIDIIYKLTQKTTDNSTNNYEGAWLCAGEIVWLIFDQLRANNVDAIKEYLVK